MIPSVFGNSEMFERKFLRGAGAVLQVVVRTSVSLVHIKIESCSGIFLDGKTAIAKPRAKAGALGFAHFETAYEPSGMATDATGGRVSESFCFADDVTRNIWIE